MTTEERSRQSFDETLEHLRIAGNDLRMQHERLSARVHELKAAAGRLHDGHRFSPVPYFELDGRGRINSCNLVGAKLLSSSPELLQGSSLESFIDPEDRGRWHDYIQATVSDEHQPPMDVRLALPGGPTLTVHAATSRSHRAGEGPVTLRVALGDVTSTQRALSDSDLRFRTMLDAAFDLVLLAPLHGPGEEGRPFIEANGEACRRLGYSRDELTRLTPQWLCASGADTLEAICASLRTDEPVIFQTELRTRSGATLPVEISARCLRLHGRDHSIWIARNITERIEAEKRRELLIGELNHRVKNSLALVQSVAEQTMRRTDDPKEFCKKLQGRLESLAASHTILAAEQWSGAPLDRLVRHTMDPFTRDDASRLKTSGPKVALSPKASQALGMYLHELGANASKYGSWSVAGGAVTLQWSHQQADDAEVLELRWEERGGPPVSEPTRKGFGTILGERLLQYEFEGEVIRQFKTAGLSCIIRLPASRVLVETES